MPQKTTLFLLGGVALIFLGVGYYNFRSEPIAIDDSKDAQTGSVIPWSDDVAEKEAQEAEKTVSSGGKPISGAVLETEKQGSESTAPWNTNAPAVSMPVPNLDRPIVFPGGYSAERAKKVTEQIPVLTAILKESSNRFNEWMDLAMLRKSIEDYEGAREIWEYAGAIRPANSLSFANLGTLYGYYLKNPIKAEANLLHAIENEPLFLNYYTRMADFYLEVIEDKEKAVTFLDRTIEKYPEWTELKELREHVMK